MGPGLPLACIMPITHKVRNLCFFIDYYSVGCIVLYMTGMELLSGFELFLNFVCAGLLSFGIVGVVALIQDLITKIID